MAISTSAFIIRESQLEGSFETPQLFETAGLTPVVPETMNKRLVGALIDSLSVSVAEFVDIEKSLSCVEPEAYRAGVAELLIPISQTLEALECFLRRHPELIPSIRERVVTEGEDAHDETIRKLLDESLVRVGGLIVPTSTT